MNLYCPMKPLASPNQMLLSMPPPPSPPFLPGVCLHEVRVSHISCMAIYSIQPSLICMHTPERRMRAWHTMCWLRAPSGKAVKLAHAVVGGLQPTAVAVELGPAHSERFSSRRQWLTAATGPARMHFAANLARLKLHPLLKPSPCL